MAAVLTGKAKGTSTVNGLARALALHEEWRVSNEERRELCPCKFDKLSPAQLMDRNMWGGYAHYLTNEHVIEQGEREGKALMGGTAIEYLSHAINCAANKCINQGNFEADMFFTCVNKDAKTPSANWYRGLRSEMVKISFDRLVVDKEEVDKSAPPATRQHINQISAVFAREGSGQVQTAARPPARPPARPRGVSPARSPPDPLRGGNLTCSCALAVRSLASTTSSPRRHIVLLAVGGRQAGFTSIRWSGTTSSMRRSSRSPRPKRRR